MTSVALLEKPIEVPTPKETVLWLEKEDSLLQEWKNWEWNSEYLAKFLPEDQGSVASEPAASSLSYELAATESAQYAVTPSMLPACGCPSCGERRDAYIRSKEKHQAYVLTDYDVLVYLVKVGETGKLGYSRQSNDCFLARVLNAKYPQFNWKVSNGDAHAYSRILVDRIQPIRLLLSFRQCQMVRVFDSCQRFKEYPDYEPVSRSTFLEAWNATSGDPIKITDDQACFVRGNAR